jgi:hypothetical protein
MSEATAAPEATAVAVLPVDDPKTFPGMLVAFKAQIAAALPKHITADRMARIALTCYRCWRAARPHRYSLASSCWHSKASSRA